MARSPWLGPLAALMVVVMFFTGCVGTQTRRSIDDRSDVAHLTHHEGDGAQKTHGGGEALAALFFVVAVVFVAAVVIDVLTLPATVPCDHEFYCCHEIIYVIER